MGRRPRRDRARRAEDALDAQYAQIPNANCQGWCAEACGSMSMTTLEQRRIEQRHGVRLPLLHYPALEAGPCPALVDGRCMVYADRPAICRLWGTVDADMMRCPHGCAPEQGLMADVEARQILRRVGRSSQEYAAARGLVG